MIRRASSPPPAGRKSRLDRSFAARTRLLGSVALGAIALAGCSVTGSNPFTGTGDISGTHLVAFATDRNQSSGQYDIALWDFDAHQFKSLPNLNSAAAEHHPSVSSDGRLIAFQVDRGSGSLDDVLIYDRLHPGFVDTPGLNTGDRETEPAFTGDGLKLVFTQGGAASPQRRIRMFAGQTKQFIPLPGLDTTNVSYSDYSPSPNGDGSIIAFVSDRSGRPQVYLYDRSRHVVIDGPKLRSLLGSAGNDVDPMLTANGRFLTWASNRAGGKGGYDLYMLEFTSVPIADTLMRDLSIANSASDDRHPTVSETGAIVVFQSNRPPGQNGGGWDIWNFNRNDPGTGPGYDSVDGYDSAGDEIEPSICWQN